MLYNYVYSSFTALKKYIYINIDQKLEQKGPSPPHPCLTFSQHDHTRCQRAQRFLPDGYSTLQAS